ncbi:MAG: D-glycero-beta-D-manno-heptose 1,7-bisphosphate 7-phosphatase [Gammaproteobacteria bacterium]|nr:D-glycero-beta-D-manno-heptose 1,7-bisphosphate 7-phosphatase [Gammaproteobacteria bacterium]
MPLIILDRDGVINKDSDDFIKSPQEFIPLPGSLEAIARLNAAGYCVTVATNQSGIARGLFDLQTLDAMHHKLEKLLTAIGGHLEGIFYCPHAPDAGCDCRKPKPGLLQQISHRLKTELGGVPVIGDSLRDLQSAQAVGAAPILVRTGKGERSLAQLAKEPGLANVPVFDDLAAAVDALLTGKLTGKTSDQQVL